MLRIGAYQGPTRVNAFEANATRSLDVLRDARQRNVDFACLPECFLTGYGTPDEIESSAVSITSRPFRDFVRQCRFGDMVSVVGFFEKRGRNLFNSAAVIHRGKVFGVHHKSVPGSPHEKQVAKFVSDFKVFRLRGITFGVLICYEGAVLEPALLLAARGARIIFEPHYSYIPADLMDYQRHRVRHSRAARAVENSVYYVKANTITEPMRKIGDTAGFGYGDSFILDDIGRPLAEAGLFTTGWITADVSRKALTSRRPTRISLVPEATRREMIRLYR